MNLDLRIAKRKLKGRNLSLVIVKSKKIIFETRERGVIEFIKAIDEHGKELHEASIADTIMGKAAAMLCRYAKIAVVYAFVMSEGGIDALNDVGIKFEYEKLVPNILDRKRDCICPFEKLTTNCDDEKECYEKIKNSLLVDRLKFIENKVRSIS